MTKFFFFIFGTFLNEIVLTTERSEVVPFFRAVRGRERGREATPPPCGGEAPTKVAMRPFVGGGVPLRSWVFDQKVVLNVDRFE